jgi:hypothetical protein
MTTRHPAQTRSAVTLLLFAAVGFTAACNDGPTGPAPEGPAAVAAKGSAKPARAPYISAVTVHKDTLDIGPDGTYDNGLDVAITNPGTRVEGVYMQYQLQQNANVQDLGGTAVCTSDGIVPHGTCTKTDWMSTPALPMTYGPAKLTIRLYRNPNDGVPVLLDARTVNVTVTHS